MNSALQINIKKHLQAKNMTAAELERRTGIPHAVINILHGRSKNPSLKTAQAIAKELGCSIEELFAENFAAGVNVKESQPEHDWDPQLYMAVFNAVYNCIQKLNLQPQPEIVASWLTEAYKYAYGSPDRKVDLRFVEWLIGRHA